MHLEADTILAFGGISLLASAFMAITGFGYGLIATSALVLWWDPHDVVLVLAIPGLLSTFMSAWRVRPEIPWAEIAPYMGWLILAIPVGALCLDIIPGRVLKGVLALLLFHTLFRSRLPMLEFLRWTPLSGLIAGIASGALGTPGGAVVSWVYGQPWKPSRKRAATLGMFTLSGIIRVSIYVGSGLLSEVGVVQMAIILLPFIAVGAKLGEVLAKGMSEQTHEWVTLVGCGFLLLALAKDVILG